jgi:hypothetical protein
VATLTQYPALIWQELIESLRESRTSRMQLFSIVQNYQVFPGFAG